MTKKLLLLFGLWWFTVFAIAQPASITVTSVQQRSDGSGLIDVYFNLSGPGSAYNIAMQASFDGGSTYTPIPPAFLSGDIAGITPGSNKHIVWDGLGSFPNTFSTQARLELTATEAIGGGIPCPGTPTLTDIDGNIYNTVLIGNQCWMKENLNTTRDAAGNNITRYCYNNNTDYCNWYGGLYKWTTVMNGASSSNSNPSGVQGICPDGWHVPSHNEWTELEQYVCNALGNDDCETKFPYNTSTTGGRGTNEGNALKSCRQINSPLGGDCNTTQHPRWNSHSTHHGFDKFGFCLFAGGQKHINNSFYHISDHATWWSSTEFSPSNVWHRNFGYNTGYINRSNDLKGFGFTTRCLKD